MKSVWTTWRLTGKLFASQRQLWVPFALSAFVELLLLGLAWLAPHAPFASVLAPPVRYFFGERVLHYPAHLWFLYHVMKHTNFVTSLLVGAFMSGVACAMVRRTHEGGSLSFRTALVSRQVRYWRMLLIWLSCWALTKGAIELLVSVSPRAAWVMWATFGALVILQALFSYAIPSSVYEGAAWWKALWRSVRETLHYPFSTLAVVSIPCVIVIFLGGYMSPGRVVQWMARTAPEIAVAAVALRLIVWMVADTMLTVGIAHLWCVHRAQPSVTVPAQQPSMHPASTEDPVVRMGHSAAA